jgi:phage portal protein BeeE
MKHLTATTYYLADKQGKTTMKKSRRNYTAEELDAALEAYRNSECLSLRQAALQFGIPPSTLGDKMRGKMYYYFKDNLIF